MWSNALLLHPLPALQWGAVLGAAAWAVCTDLRSRRIPNALTLPLLVAGLAQAVALGGWAGLADSLAAAVLLALPYVLLFAFAGGGAGDAKLMGAVGAWLGIVKGGLALATVSLSGVLLACAFAALGGRGAELLLWLRSALHTIAYHIQARSAPRLALEPAAEATPGRCMPYAPAIALGLASACTGWWLWLA